MRDCFGMRRGVADLRLGLGKLLDSRELSDLTYVVEGRSLRAHQVVLSMFQANFASEWTEVEPGSACEVVVPRVSYAGFKSMMEWMYCDRTDFSVEVCGLSVGGA